MPSVIPAGSPSGQASEQRAVNGQAIVVPATQKTGLRREDAIPVYRLALEESRNAFAELMAQPEKIRRNGVPYSASPALGFQSSALLLDGRIRYFSGCRSVRSLASWAWLDAQLLSCGHGNWCRPARQTRSLPGATLGTPKPPRWRTSPSASRRTIRRTAGHRPPVPSPCRCRWLLRARCAGAGHSRRH